MSEPNKRKKPRQSPAPPPPPQATSGSAAESTSKQQSRPQANATAVTKYDVLPPRPQQAASTPGQASSSSSSQAHQTSMQTPTPAPMTPTFGTGNNPAFANSAQLLAKARAKLAATKPTKQDSTSAPTPTPQPDIQNFEATYLKTIKCDVCEERNGDILYKCQNCPFHHQICSVCVMNTKPSPDGNMVGRKDWSVHARLKNAHNDYIKPNCLGRNDDGSYQGHGVNIVLAQGKKGGAKKSKKTATKKDVTAADRNSAARRALGKNKTTEQGRRIEEMARARYEQRMDPGLRERVAAAKARLDQTRKAEAEAATEDQVQGTKRKAAVLEDDDGEESGELGEDEDEVEDEDVENDGDGDDDEDGDDSVENVVEDDEDEGFDPLETAAAMEESMRDTGRE
jgi:hypothetical protein